MVVASSVLVPLVGIITAPVLAHSLGADGRGISAAAAAPFLVASTAASAGIPQAVTYFIAQDRYISRTTAFSVLAITVAVGFISTGIVFLGRDYLSGGEQRVGDLIMVGGMLVTPALLVGLLRGVATGRQMWREVATERVLGTAFKAIGIIGLAVVGQLSIVTAVLVLCLSPILGGVAYAPLMRQTSRIFPSSGNGKPPLRLIAVLRYGSSVWLGGVALMLMARINEMFVLPLSDAFQLGLLVVAVTISDIPWIVTQALREVLFGASSKELDPQLLGKASRVSALGAVVLGTLIGTSMSYWLGPVFGDEFRASAAPAVLLLLSAAVAVPGLVAGAGLEAAGRPHLRSITLTVSLGLNLLLVFLLTSEFGATGAAGAVLGTTLFSTVVTVILSAYVLKVPVWLFVHIQISDVRFLLQMSSRISTVARLPKRRKRST